MKKLVYAAPALMLVLLWAGRRETPVSPARSGTTRRPAAAPVPAPAPQVAGPATPVAAMAQVAPAERTQAVDRIMKLQKCFDSEDCAFTQEDPRSYQFAVGRALAKELNAFRLKYVGQADAQVDFGFLARTFMQSYDGFVGAEALAMLSTLPVSNENLEALTTGLKNSPDPKLMALALPELQRYLGTPWESDVHKFINETIETGAHFASKKVTESVLPFINASSYDSYRETLTHLRPQTQAAKDLSAALEEFERLQTGA